MSNFALHCTLLLVVVLATSAHQHYHERECEEPEYYILDTSLVKVVQSAAGEIRSVIASAVDNRPLWEHDVVLGCITMEPNALLLPQYMDAASVFFVQQGEALVKWIRGTSVASKNVKAGDVFSMPAGAVFYLVSISNQERLKVLGMMDTSTSLKRGRAQHFFVAGGIEPSVVFSGFDTDTLAAAFKVSPEEIVHFFSSQRQGPIIQTKVQLSGLKEGKDQRESVHAKEQEQDGEKTTVDNLFDRPSFHNSFGWSSAASTSNKRFDVFAVHLKAGSMHAPHWNSRGSEFGIVTEGRGTIQISYPNGTSAAEEKLKPGTVFYVPQLLPSCQIAADDSALEYVGFTVLSPGMQTENEMQFLAGYDSVLQKLDLSIVALSLNVPEQLVKSFLNSQQEAMILPSPVHSDVADH